MRVSSCSCSDGADMAAVHSTELDNLFAWLSIKLYGVYFIMLNVFLSVLFFVEEVLMVWCELLSSALLIYWRISGRAKYSTELSHKEIIVEKA